MDTNPPGGGRAERRYQLVIARIEALESLMAMLLARDGVAAEAIGEWRRMARESHDPIHIYSAVNALVRDHHGRPYDGFLSSGRPPGGAR